LAWDVYSTGTLMQKSAKDIFILIVYVFWLFFVLQKKQVVFGALKSTRIVMLFCSVAIMHALIAIFSSFYVGIMGLRNVIEFVPLIFLVPSLFITKDDIRRIINLSIWCSLLVALAGVYETYKIIPVWGLAILGNYRVHSFLFNPNNLGIYSAVFILLLLAMYFTKNYFISKTMTVVGIIIISSSLILTFSRTALFGLTLGSLYLMYRNKRKELFLISVVVIIGIAGVVTYFFPQSRYGEISNFEKHDSVTGRTQNIVTAIELIKEQPALLIFGAGFDKVTGIMDISKQDTFTRVGGKGSEKISSDNFYLALIMGGGIIGFSLFLAMLLFLLRESKMINRATKDPYFKTLTQGISAVFVLYIFSGVGGMIWSYFPINFYFWLFAGLLISIKMIAKQESLKGGE